MRNYIGREKKRRYQLKLSWWCYDYILGFTGRVQVGRESTKISSADLSMRAIFCIIKFTKQENIIRSGNLSHGSFHLSHWLYQYLDDTGKY